MSLGDPVLPNYLSAWIIGQTSRSQCGYNIIYLDFAKAFGSVPHERLLEKVKCYGIRGDILEWTRLFIKG